MARTPMLTRDRVPAQWRAAVKEAAWCPWGLVGSLIRDDLIVQEEEVNPLEFHVGQALVETPLQQWQNLAGCPVADGTLGRHAHAFRQSAPKGLAEHHLGFATAIACATSKKVMPASQASRTVAIASSRVVGPQT
jgi:hypothetical protein